MTPRLALISLLLFVAFPRPASPADAGEDLLAAAKKGDPAAVKSLLAGGADANARSPYGATPLNFAAEKGHLGVVEILLKHKADVNARDNFYKATPLIWAALGGHADIATALLKAGATDADDALVCAATQGHAAAVRAILGAAKMKTEALTLALQATPPEHTAVAALLLKAGAKAPAPVSEPLLPPLLAEEVKGAKKPAPVPQGVVKTPLNWPSFRGPNGSGVADGQFPPLTWDAEKGHNIRWKTPIPGLGLSSPVVWGDRVYLTTAVGAAKAALKTGQYGDVGPAKDQGEHAWKVLCLDKNNGQVLWERTASKGVPRGKRHTKSSHANPTPATDGKHVVVSFGSEGLYCYDPDGDLLWQKNLGALDAGWFFDETYQWGFGSSPILYQDLVIVQCDVGKGSFLAAFRVADGTEAWRTERDEIPSWGTPTIVTGPDRVELVTAATKFARGYDPLTGQELWRLARHSEITVPTPVYGAGLIFIASGYSPIMPIYAIRPGAHGDISLKAGQKANDAVAWSTHKGGPYMPTPVVYGDYFYVGHDHGLVTCFEAKTGKVVYRERIGNRDGYTASVVAGDGRLYFTSEEGSVTVVKAGPAFEVLAVNELDDPCLATPAISDGMIFIRTQHYLFGIGSKGPPKE